MNNIPVSLFLGPLFAILFFAACAVSVAGVKTLILFFRRAPIKLTPPKKPKVPAAPPVKAVKPVKSIEINPDEVDRIYVKKIS